jgi:hypothetical protein
MDASIFKDLMLLLVFLAVGFLLVKHDPKPSAPAVQDPTSPSDLDVVTVQGGAKMPRRIAKFNKQSIIEE